MSKIDYNIVLCGFMGSGKTSVGRRLSEVLKVDFVDTDKCIEEELGMPISEIFARYGEEHFRNLENRVIGNLSECRGVVISTGGGTVVNKTNAELLRKNGKIVFLDAPLGEIELRLKSDNTRPLFRHNDDVKSLFEERKNIYNNISDFSIAGIGSIEEICEKIVNKLANNIIN